MDIITLHDLTKAISNCVGVKKDKARKVAGFVLDLFGYEDRVIDNRLDPEDRQLFYMLEGSGILATGREETTLHDGREWLTHFWQLRKNSILRYARKNPEGNEASRTIKEQKKEFSDKTIYTKLPEYVWSMRKINKKKTLGRYFLFKKS
jgi:hypothetical protein